MFCFKDFPQKIKKVYFTNGQSVLCKKFREVSLFNAVEPSGLLLRLLQTTPTKNDPARPPKTCHNLSLLLLVTTLAGTACLKCKRSEPPSGRRTQPRPPGTTPGKTNNLTI